MFDPPSPFSVTSEVLFTALELGSGTGYVGLELAKTLGKEDMIILTDLEEVCPLLELNKGAGAYLEGRVTETAQVLQNQGSSPMWCVVTCRCIFHHFLDRCFERCCD